MVPTMLAYNMELGDIMASWGYLCPTPRASDQTRLIEHFKLYLEQRIFERVNHKVWKIDDVRRFFEDFLRAVYRHIKSALKLLPTTKVEYHFSVPTTWAHHDMVEEFRNIVQLAGYGSAGNNGLHSVDIALSEAEAAAVYAMKVLGQKFNVSRSDALAVTNYIRISC
jgi:hypothetical protein